jgi:hypothetical protein
MKKVTLSGGGLEYVHSDEDKQVKENLKAVKKASDLKDSDVKNLVYQLAKQANLI